MQYGHQGREVVKLVELPLNGAVGNFLALNKALPDELVARFQASYNKLSKQGLLEKYIEQYKAN